MPQRIIITGGAGNIGSAVTKLFDLKGAHTIVIDKNKDACDALAAQIKYGTSIPADITKADYMSEVIRCLDELQHASSVPGFDHLVSVAGGLILGETGSLEQISEEAIRESIDFNLTSHLLLAKRLHPYMRPGIKRHGLPSITFISSINAIRAYDNIAYSVAKAGLLGAVNILAKKLGPEGIRINAVLPGTVPPSFDAAASQAFDSLREETVLGYFATPRNIADMVYQITQNSGITGQTFVVDAGQSINSNYP